jgi:hypothetical protein
MIPAIRGQLHACRRKAGPHYNLIGGFAVMGAGVGVSGGTYATTGSNAKIVKQVAPLAMARGLFAMTAGNAAIDGPGAKNFAPSTGAFALTGRNAVLGAGLPDASGAFALTGNSAKMTVGPGAGRFALTGNNAVMGAATGLGAASFAMTGITARLNPGKALLPGTGSFTLTGRNAVLGEGLGASTGTYALTGNAATLFRGHGILGNVGSFSLTGRAANMAQTGHGLPASSGTFVLTERYARLTPSLADGSYTLTGKSASLYPVRNLLAGSGSFSLTGRAALLSRVAASGTFALTGRAAGMSEAAGLGAATYTLTGRAAGMGTSLGTPFTGAGAGSFSLIGNNAAMVGQNVTLNPSDKSADITLSNGNLTFTGTNTPGHNYNVRGTQAGAAGRYFEVTYSTIAANTGTPGVGVANLSQSLSAYPGDPNAVGWFQSGYTEWPGSGYSNNFGTFAVGDVLGVYRRTSTIEFFKNGAIVGTAVGLPSGALYPIISPLTNGDTGTANFGATALSYLPLGATSWDGSQTNTDTGAHSGTFTLTGRKCRAGRRISALSGTFSLTGRTAGMSVGAALAVSSPYGLTGNAASMAVGLSANSASFAMTGRAALIATGHGLAAGSGTFAMTGRDAAIGVPNAMNPSDAGPSGELTFSNSNKTVTHTLADNTFAAVRSLRGWSTGKHYAEIHIDYTTGGGNTAIGIFDNSSTPPQNSAWGNSSDGFAYWSNGWGSYNANWVQMGSGLTTGTTLMIAYDADLKRAYLGANGTWFNSCNPSAGTGYIDMSSPGPSGAVYLSIGIGRGDVMTAYFTNASFAYTPPTGFSGD